MAINKCPSMPYSCSTLQNSDLEKSGHMAFLDQQACEGVLCILPGFLITLLLSENLIRGAAIWTKTTPEIFQL